MRYKIVLRHSEEGCSVSVPGLPGCWSQGATEEEALENIKDAIHEYLQMWTTRYPNAEIREIEVAVWRHFAMGRIPGINHLDARCCASLGKGRISHPSPRQAPCHIE
jgi:predicted RNase H-like HicB family nuclease